MVEPMGVDTHVALLKGLTKARDVVLTSPPK